MKTKSIRSGAFIIGFCLLLGVRAFACDPPCPPCWSNWPDCNVWSCSGCQRCNGLECVWNCITGQTCCNNSCCSGICCPLNEICCTQGACCDGIACYNPGVMQCCEYGDGTTCLKEEYCYGGECVECLELNHCPQCEYCDPSHSCQDILVTSIDGPQYVCVGQWVVFQAATEPGYSCHFSWDHQGAANSESDCNWSRAQWDESGVYTVTFGCNDSDSITVTVVEVGAIENDRDAVCLCDQDGIVFTAIAEPDGPLDCLVWQGRRKEDVNEPWSGWGTVGHTYVSSNQIRLHANMPGYYQFRAQNGSDPNSWAESAEVVVVELVKMQYNDSANGWTDISGTMFAYVDSLIEFRAVKEPNTAPWPSGKPVWSGSSGASGTDVTEITVTFDTVSSHPDDYMTVQVQCGTMLTANVIVCQAKVENVTFYYGTLLPGHHTALNIRVDDANDISVPEWVEGGQNMPAAYIMDVNNIDIKVTIDILPQVSTTLPATIWATTGSAVLGNVNEKDDIYFYGGSSGEVIFTVAGASAYAVSKDDLAWQWKVKDFAHSTGEKDINVSGPHTIYTVLDTPAAPQDEPWIGTLEIACTAAADANSVEDATRRIWDNFYNSAGGYYDTENGAPQYTLNGEGGVFDLSKWLRQYPSIGKVNCYDMAKAIVVFSNALGCNAVNTYVQPFGYLNCIKPIGKGWTNNPFYDHPDVVSIPIVDINHPYRSGFGNHAFARLGGWVYDASAGQVDVDGTPYYAPHDPNNLDGNDTWNAYYRTKLIQQGTPGSPQNHSFGIGKVSP